MAPISSLTNARVKQIRRLRSRKERERTGTFYVEGIRIVAQAVQSGATVEMGVVSADLLSSEFGWELVASLRAGGVPIVELSPAAFASISFKENLQGIGAVVRPRLESLEDIRLALSEVWGELDAVGNSGNLGAILRTC